jgi:hypothetical protein
LSLNNRKAVYLQNYGNLNTIKRKVPQLQNRGLDRFEKDIDKLLIMLWYITRGNQEKMSFWLTYPFRSYWGISPIEFILIDPQLHIAYVIRDLNKYVIKGVTL